MLRDLELYDVYDSAKTNLTEDLMVPCISNSILYIRGVGFFTSGWLRLATKGIVQLAMNGGKAIFIVSPHIEEEDWEAMQRGILAKDSPELHSLLVKNIDALRATLEQDTRNALAWLIADGILEFHFAVPRNRDPLCDYHDKVGLCIDEAENRVVFHGSFNDSIKGTMNGEAFSVFRSWTDGQRPYVDLHDRRLTELLANANSQFEVVSIPKVIKDELIRLRTTSFRPYQCQNDIEYPTNATIVIPVELRDYQKTAVQAWLDAECIGMYDMATGTGKTITALAAAATLFHQRQSLALVILAPYLHLVEQWVTEVKQFGFRPLCCSSENTNWESQLYDTVNALKLGTQKHLCIIATHMTAATQKFADAINRCAPDHLMLLADETHALGAMNLRKALLPTATFRLGLSATPKRWYDAEGTSVLSDYYRSVVFEMPIEQAIGPFLTPYEYRPVPVCLNSTELDEYVELTQKIGRVATTNNVNEEGITPQLNMLLIKRSRLVMKADEKYERLRQILQQLLERGPVQHLLVYCAPGEAGRVVKILSGSGILCHRFTHEESLDVRKQLLRGFQTGTISALVAIKCLDEGVDVPESQTAIFLASTTNPREFVQRRGRILRHAKSKDFASIFDMLVLPDAHAGNTDKEIAKSLIRREMPRFAEFVSSAKNEYAAKEVVEPILDYFGMTNYMDLRPWEMHGKMAELREIESDSLSDDEGIL